jgi:iron complex outermembrane receptor protein
VQSNIVARVFNNAFSGALLTLVDNRFASVPSLRINVPALLTTTNDDIERMEVVLGPAAALYGPNSANGVLAIFTKSPFESRGTSLALEAGDRGILKAGFRTATVVAERVGLKFSYEQMAGGDFRYVDPEEPATVPRPPEPGDPREPTAVSRNYRVERNAGEFRIDYRYSTDTDVIGSYGFSNFGSGIELTGAGGSGQVRDWSYNHAQLRLRHKGLFAQAFTNFNDAGNTDSLDNRGTFLLRSGNPIVDHSRIVALQAQQKWEVSPTFQLIFGADYIKTNPDTKGTINGRNEHIDEMTEYGFYAHSLTRLSPKFDLVAAVRTDYQSVVEDQTLAPRVGLVFKPNDGENWRLTFNRAQFTPANFAYFLDLQVQPLNPALPYILRSVGNNGGFTFKRDCADGIQGLCMKSPFNATPGAFVNAGGVDLFRAGLAVVSPGLQAALSQTHTPQQIAAIMTALAGLAPTNAQLGTYLRVAVPGQGLLPFTGPVEDIRALEPEVYDVLELGYKKILGTKGRVTADFWFQRRNRFTAPAGAITPNTFVNPQSLGAYIIAALTPDHGANTATTVAGVISAGLAPVPLGTVTPDHPLANDFSVLASYTQVDEQLDIYGTDLSLSYLLTDKWSVTGTYSWVSEDYFPDIFGSLVAPLALNAPDNKGSVTVGFRDETSGFSAEVRGRYANAFPVNSAVYVGDVPVNAFVDLSAAYRLPVRTNLVFSLGVTNVLDNKRPSFIGVPDIGRMAIGRLQVSF